MPSAAFTTLGCKVNQYETQRILESFENAGFSIVPFTDVADVYVINTCSVTSQAESKSRQTVRRAKRLNENAVVVATGCATQMSLNKSECFDSADLIVPNPDKLDSFDLFAEKYADLARRALDERKEHAPRKTRTRATVKLQDGCSVYCSYCSIPYTRPGMKSRYYQEVLDEIASIGSRGQKEVILTGVLIGTYGPETGSGGPDFEELVSLICAIDGIERIRISSIEMRQVTARLIELLKQTGAKVVPHLHIPLQSGSTKVLREMNRPYSQEDYLALCRDLYRDVPGIGISADVMVGFPTETHEDFLETVKVCQSVRYVKTHLFRFSPRYGTPADTWGDPISPQVKQERSAILNDVANSARREFFQRYVGRVVDVLVEEKHGPSGLLKGHSGNYIEVEFAGPQSLIGEICAVKILSADANVAVGELAGGKYYGLPILQNS